MSWEAQPTRKVWSSGGSEGTQNLDGSRTWKFGAPGPSTREHAGPNDPCDKGGMGGYIAYLGSLRQPPFFASRRPCRLYGEAAAAAEVLTDDVRCPCMEQVGTQEARNFFECRETEESVYTVRELWTKCWQLKRTEEEKKAAAPQETLPARAPISAGGLAPISIGDFSTPHDALTPPPEKAVAGAGAGGGNAWKLRLDQRSQLSPPRGSPRGSLPPPAKQPLQGTISAAASVSAGFAGGALIALVLGLLFGVWTGKGARATRHLGRVSRRGPQMAV